MVGKAGARTPVVGCGFQASNHTTGDGHGRRCKEGLRGDGGAPLPARRPSRRSCHSSRPSHCRLPRFSRGEAGRVHGHRETARHSQWRRNLGRIPAGLGLRAGEAPALNVCSSARSSEICRRTSCVSAASSRNACRRRCHPGQRGQALGRIRSFFGAEAGSRRSQHSRSCRAPSRDRRIPTSIESAVGCAAGAGDPIRSRRFRASIARGTSACGRRTLVPVCRLSSSMQASSEEIARRMNGARASISGGLLRIAAGNRSAADQVPGDIGAELLAGHAGGGFDGGTVFGGNPASTPIANGLGRRAHCLRQRGRSPSLANSNVEVSCGIHRAHLTPC